MKSCNCEEFILHQAEQHMAFVTRVRSKPNIRSFWINTYLLSPLFLVAILIRFEVASFGCRYFQCKMLLILQELLELHTITCHILDGYHKMALATV